MTPAEPENAAGIAEKFAVGAGERERAGGARGVFGRLRAEPLLPDSGSGGAPLTAAIAVMSFLAALALAAFILISAATGAWTDDLRSALTIQIKGPDAAAIAADTAAVVAVLEDAEGVIEIRAMTPEESARLLEPWLGKGNVGAYLNVPAIVEVKIDEALRADLASLEALLKTTAPGATIDDHGAWHERLSAAARSGQALAFFVFVLVMGAACAISVLAARAGLAANSDIVSLLHLVGATDDFIAGQVQRRFLVLGLRGSLAGLLLAILALGLAALTLRAAGGAADFIPAMDLGPEVAAPLLGVPLALCIVAALSARITVLKALQREL